MRRIRASVVVNCRRRTLSSSSEDGRPPVEQQVQRMRDRFHEEAPSKQQRNVWEDLWQEGTTPWDLGRPTPLLRSELVPWRSQECNKVPAFRALVPGCGAGYDLISIAQWIDERETTDPPNVVVGLDLSETSLQRASEVVGNDTFSALNRTCVKLMCGDFFQDESWKSVASFGATPTDVTGIQKLSRKHEPFDFIFDYTFFCALPPSLRSAWGEQTVALLTPNTGRLLTIVFPVIRTHSGGSLKGPPYPVTEDDYKQVLEPHGLIRDGPLRVHPDTVPARIGQELVGWWKWNT
jgi:methyl halide transferase